MNIEIDTRSFDAKAQQAIADFGRAMARAVDYALDAGYAEARTEVPVRTGELKRRIFRRTTKRDAYGARGTLRATAPYARPVNDGSRPHVITAKNAPALRFRSRDGGWISKKSVNHPGTKPRPFMTMARRRTALVLHAQTAQQLERFKSRFR